MSNRRFRKTLSAIISAALMLQSGMTGLAEEAGTAVTEMVQETSAEEGIALAAQSEAESEAARKAAEAAAQSEAESEAARKAAEAAAQSEAESEAARKAAEAAAQSEAESEAARKESEAAAAAQSEAESEAARKESEAAAAAQSEAESEAARKESEAAAAAQSEAESEAARKESEAAATEAPSTEAQTQAPTEAPSTEAQTQAPTEAPSTEAQTQAPTEAPSTEAQTQAPTEAPVTEAQTQAADQEETSSDTKKKKKKKSKKKETERSEYENEGEKISAKDAATELRFASPYLFAAEVLEAADDLLKGQKTAVGEAGTAILSALEDYSLELADAVSSSDLEIVNLYADEDGKLDKTQLEDLYEDCVIDVSSKYFVVNIIADEAKQELDFAGYDMLLSGSPVKYESAEQPCDIIYNFAAWDDGDFADYEGTLTLADEAGLQGIFLAPAAEVKVNSDLAGSVYAKTISVDDSVQNLLKLTFAQSTVVEAQSEETATEDTEAVTEESEEAVTEEVSEVQSEEAAAENTEADTETVTEETGEVQSEGVTAESAEAVTEESEAQSEEVVTEESEAQSEEVVTEESEAQSEEAVTEEGSEAQSVEAVTEESEAQSEEAVTEESEAQSEAVTESVTELGEITITAEPESEAVTETVSQETELFLELPLGEEELIVEAAAEELLAASQAEALSESETMQEIEVRFSVSLSDAVNGDAVAGKVSIKAAHDMINAEGVTVYAEASEAETFTFGTDTEAIHEFGTKLTCAGDYYLEVTDLPADYVTIPRIYFTVGAEGILWDSSDWNAQENTLALKLYKKEEAVNAPVLELYAEDGVTALTGAVFVVKDKDGNVIRNTEESGYPEYYISYSGVPVMLNGLAEGEYILSQTKAATGQVQENGEILEGAYQVAEDLAFEVSAAAAAAQLIIINKPVPTEGKSLTVSAQAYYSTVADNSDPKTNVLLTAEEDNSYYFAVYTKSETGMNRISEVWELMIPAGCSDSNAVLAETAAEETATAAKAASSDTGTAIQEETDIALQADTSGADAEITVPGSLKTPKISGLTEGTYYLAATDEYGTLVDPQQIGYRLQETDETAKMTMTPVVIGAQDTEKEAVLQHVYQNGQYPEHRFSYMADVMLTASVVGRDGKALSVNDTLYAALYGDAALEMAVTAEPVALELKKAATVSASCQIKMTTAEGTFYVAQTDAKGKPVTPESGFAYAITYPGNETGAFTVSCGQTAQVQIQNKLNDSVVKLALTSTADGSYLAGAVLAIKNSSGRVIAINNAKTFASKDTAIELKNLLEDGKKYYLSEIQAPAGYAPAPDVQFTVKKGQTTEVVLSNAPSSATEYQLTVSKQVYSGENQVYAYDTTNKAYAKAGAYTFYAALFSDAKHTKKVSDVQEMTVSGFSGTTTFKNLEQGKTYYLAETTQYGEVYKSTTSTRTIRYTDGGKIVLSEKSQSAIIQNVYNKLPGGYRYTGTLTIKAQVTDTTDKALAVNSTFYAGIYRKADFSDKPTIIKLELKNASSVSVKRRILLSGENDMTYYIAELDANGNRLTEESAFSYVVSIDQPEVAVSKGSDKVVTITNKVKSTKATLYLTKKVYEGTKLKKVNETFYAGLFKDAEFKELYTNPIPLKLENKSELTLKLSLNLGTASRATIYIAEVDKNGKVIRNQRDFGYEVRIINSTAAFTQEKLEIQTILVNSVYGTSSSEEWNDIYDNEVEDSYTGSYGGSSYGGGSYSGYSGGSDGGYFSDNGEASWEESGVETGDDTPVLLYVILFGLSAAVIFAGLFAAGRRRRCK